MAAEYAISDPAFSPINTELARMVEKGQKKQQRELAKLKAVLQLVEKQVADTKSSASSQASPSNNKFEESMADMVLALQMLQVLIAKYGNSKARQHSTISDAQLELAKDTLKNVKHQLEKMQKDAKGKKIAGEVEKWAEVALGVVTMLVGAVLAQPELIVMGILSLVAASGALQDLTKATTKGLEALGIPKNFAKPLAAILVCAVVIAASSVAMNPEAAGEELAEAGTEVGTDAADSAASATDTAASATDTESSALREVKTALRKAKNGFRKVMQKLGPRGRVRLMALFTSLSSTQAVQETYNSIALSQGISKKKREEIERDLGYAIMALSFVMTIAMGIGAAGASESANTTAISLKTAQRLRTGLMAGTALGTIGEASGQFAQGRITMDQGSLQKELLTDQATLGLLGTLMQMNSDETLSDQRAQASSEKGIKLDDRSATELMKGVEGFANIAAYSSPV